MKNFELKNLGVQEMNKTEMTKVNGGLLGISINLNPLLTQVGTTLSNTFAFISAQLTLISTALKNL
ncbi:hypothetical protein [Mucilaginibacter aquaedulcis]|uniref:hypothetical protein n=1 Tax=Mucilaginibacter aquaedulcis TaxID=1187081 RepID=UPI0025B5D181|nr:hypothetical protein [Mucilaginibacter aquaedulcis]MDN3549604.1 hypothetical protein [Mucilaginibacter aquaedulcis]